MPFQWVSWNPFSVFFNKTPKAEQLERQQKENSQGHSQEEIDAELFNSGTMPMGVYNDAHATYVDFEPVLANKAARISKYREMSIFPEINNALDIVCDEAIQPDNDGSIARLIIKNTDSLPAGTRARVLGAYDYLVETVLNLNVLGWEYFRKFVTEAELYLELIANTGGTDLVGSKVLPAHTIMPVIENDILKGYAQVSYANGLATSDGTISPNIGAAVKEPVAFKPEQIAYVNYGQYGMNRLDVRGFLEPAVRIYNQLKSLEDSLIIYRLVRAPERRVWNVYTGNMPPQKAEAFLKNTIKAHKQRLVYDSQSGDVDSSANVKNMSEDIWFTKDASGNGTTIETVGGAVNLGEITDVKYFLNKLHLALKIPQTRVDDPNSVYTSGKSGEMLRQEVKFSHFIERLQQQFKKLVMDSFITLLHMRGIDEQYCDPALYDVKFTPSNLFKNYKELEVLEARLGILASVSPYIYNKDNEGGLFSRKYAMLKLFRMEGVDYAENEVMLNVEKGNPPPPAGEGGGGGEGAGGSMTTPPPTGGTPEAGGAEAAPAPEAPPAEAPAPEAT